MLILNLRIILFVDFYFYQNENNPTVSPTPTTYSELIWFFKLFSQYSNSHISLSYPAVA